jgi:hypothetical protein
MFLGGGVVGLLVLGFWIWAIFDVITTDEVLVRNLPKGMWLMLVIFLADIGAIAWLLLGRPENVGFKPGDTSPRAATPRVRPAPLEAADRQRGAAERRKSREEERLEYEELDRRLKAERDERRRQLEDTISKHDQRAKDLADWEADLLRRERELRDAGPPDTT